ncbi:hypothetical protein Nepgr_001127 [Nepenthes gracilis]|uniref:Chalcone isomerase domain-containing protein n=1 Tax=Nepenthes gracilis TaxID=150966 RepID=A0AAD3P6I5_NEPGR|nr:hypothetical protein Nepgr_001127 [Nepenthes gracilis]
MGNNWLLFMDLDGQSPYYLPTDPLISRGFGSQLFSQFSNFVDSSLYQSRNIVIPGSLALREAFNCVSKFAGALIFWFSGPSNSNVRNKLSDIHGSGPGKYRSFRQVKNVKSSKHNLTGFRISSRSRSKSVGPLVDGKISSFSIRYLFRKSEKLPALSIAAAVVPPFSSLNPSIIAIPVENADVQMQGSLDQRPCEVEHQGYAGLSIPDFNRAIHAVEPRTGIEFPTILNSILAEENKSSFSSEVLVGTGSKTLRIIKIKSLRVYAFGFYVHPYSVCEKLGPKYVSVPVAELKKCHDFYEDLLREDIGMTIRLVVNCNGMKINTVKDAFEKSLRARLVKMNPDTDYKCLRTFGSCFTQDIPLPTGTTIDFRRTADGQLTTEIGGNLMGAVHSKDLCRAFFDMYIGDAPISEQTKEEIGRNIASIIRRC